MLGMRLPSSSPTAVESRPGRIGPISLGAKQTGERSAGNPHAAFDEAGAGNVAWSRWCDTRRRKGETTGNTNFDLHRAPVLDPTWERPKVKFLRATRHYGEVSDFFLSLLGELLERPD